MSINTSPEIPSTVYFPSTFTQITQFIDQFRHEPQSIPFSYQLHFAEQHYIELLYTQDYDIQPVVSDFTHAFQQLMIELDSICNPQTSTAILCSTPIDRFTILLKCSELLGSLVNIIKLHPFIIQLSSIHKEHHKKLLQTFFSFFLTVLLLIDINHIYHQFPHLTLYQIYSLFPSREAFQQCCATPQSTASNINSDTQKNHSLHLTQQQCNQVLPHLLWCLFSTHDHLSNIDLIACFPFLFHFMNEIQTSTPLALSITNTIFSTLYQYPQLFSSISPAKPQTFNHYSNFYTDFLLQSPEHFQLKFQQFYKYVTISSPTTSFTTLFAANPTLPLEVGMELYSSIYDEFSLNYMENQTEHSALDHILDHSTISIFYSAFQSYISSSPHVPSYLFTPSKFSPKIEPLDSYFSNTAFNRPDETTINSTLSSPHTIQSTIKPHPDYHTFPDIPTSFYISSILESTLPNTFSLFEASSHISSNLPIPLSLLKSFMVFFSTQFITDTTHITKFSEYSVPNSVSSTPSSSKLPTTLFVPNLSTHSRTIVLNPYREPSSKLQDDPLDILNISIQTQIELKLWLLAELGLFSITAHYLSKLPLISEPENINLLFQTTKYNQNDQNNNKKALQSCNIINTVLLQVFHILKNITPLHHFWFYTKHCQKFLSLEGQLLDNLKMEHEESMSKYAQMTVTFQQLDPNLQEKYRSQMIEPTPPPKSLSMQHKIKLLESMGNDWNPLLAVFRSLYLYCGSFIPQIIIIFKNYMSLVDEQIDSQNIGGLALLTLFSTLNDICNPNLFFNPLQPSIESNFSHLFPTSLSQALLALYSDESIETSTQAKVSNLFNNISYNQQISSLLTTNTLFLSIFSAFIFPQQLTTDLIMYYLVPSFQNDLSTILVYWVNYIYTPLFTIYNGCHEDSKNTKTQLSKPSTTTSEPSTTSILTSKLSKTSSKSTKNTIYTLFQIVSIRSSSSPTLLSFLPPRPRALFSALPIVSFYMIAVHIVKSIIQMGFKMNKMYSSVVSHNEQMKHDFDIYNQTEHPYIISIPPHQHILAETTLSTTPLITTPSQNCTISPCTFQHNSLRPEFLIKPFLRLFLDTNLAKIIFSTFKTSFSQCVDPDSTFSAPYLVGTDPFTLHQNTLSTIVSFLNAAANLNNNESTPITVQHLNSIPILSTPKTPHTIFPSNVTTFTSNLNSVFQQIHLLSHVTSIVDDIKHNTL